MANNLREASAPLSAILTDKAGLVGAEVVSAQPSVGQTGLTVYPIPSAAVTQTQDSADGTVGNTAPTVATEVGGVGADGKLRGLSTDNTGILKAEILGNAGATLDAARGAAAPTNAVQVGGVGADGNIYGLSTDNQGQLKVSGSVFSSIIQKASGTQASGTTVQAVFSNPVKSGNSVVVLLAAGSSTLKYTPTDSFNSFYACSAGNPAQAMTALLAYTNLQASGSITITVTANGTTDMAIEVYEVSGHICPCVSNTSAGASQTQATVSFTAINRNNLLAFLAVAAKGNVSLPSPAVPVNSVLDNNLASGGGTNLGAVSAVYQAPFGLGTTVGYNGSLGTMTANIATANVACVGVCFYNAPISVTGSVTINSEASAAVDGGTPQCASYARIGNGSPTESSALWMTTIGYLHNGTSWDRQRGNLNTTTGDAPTIVSATTTNGATQTNYNFRGAVITVILGTVSGTTPTLAAQLQYSPDGGTTWLNFSAAAAVNSIATGNTLELTVYPQSGMETLGAGGPTFKQNVANPLPRTWRMNYITTGSSLSIAIASVQVNYIL